jgi:hypothetical protein
MLARKGHSQMIDLTTLSFREGSGRMTLGEAFRSINEQLENFADETIARRRAEGDDEETLAVLSAHLLRRRAEILEQLFAPLLVTRH